LKQITQLQAFYGICETCRQLQTNYDPSVEDDSFKSHLAGPRFVFIGFPIRTAGIALTQVIAIVIYGDNKNPRNALIFITPT